MLTRRLSPNGNTPAAASSPVERWIKAFAVVLTGVAVVGSAFHFWPLQDSKAWRILCLPNLAVLVWCLTLAVCAVRKPIRQTIVSLLPHLSVLAYLMVSVLSVAFAADPGRAISFTVKLVLVLVGAYLLFSFAISGVRSLRIVYSLTTAAAVISVSYCLLGKYGFHAGSSGFFGNPYKYGTYIGTLVPLSAAYLFMSSRDWKRLLGGVLVVEALISAGSLGAVAAIVAGVMLSVVLVPRWSVKLCIVASLMCGIGILILLGSSPAIAPLRHDTKLAEADHSNVRQRYIEWQAEINLLEDRSMTGTAAGCINDYRGNFYYRLPKLNTLQPFDQNGWLATGAETGIMGLVCFCWIVVYYLRLAYSQLTTASGIFPAAVYRFAIANFVGLVAACTANLFSSVHYNGVLIVFVLVLVMISRTNQLFVR
jgi:hypothetical protein